MSALPRRPRKRIATGLALLFALFSICPVTADAAGSETDFRVFKIRGFVYLYAPGVQCGTYRQLEQLPVGREFIDDENATKVEYEVPLAKMTDRNLATARSPGFQRATGCRAATRCELKFAFPYYDPATGTRFDPLTPRFDPQCRHDATQLVALAGHGSQADFAAALSGATQAWSRPDERGRDVFDRAYSAARGEQNCEAAALLEASAPHSLSLRYRGIHPCSSSKADRR